MQRLVLYKKIRAQIHLFNSGYYEKRMRTRSCPITPLLSVVAEQAY